MRLIDINKLRLQNQQLAQPHFTKPADIVRWLGAVQAQDYGGAKWALGQRLKGATDKIIEKAFTNGDIIRTHVLRPTWHFVAPEDLKWMLELTSARIQATAGTQHRQFKLDNAVFAKCEKAIQTGMEGGRQLMRSEIAELLQQAGVETNEQRFIHIMMQMELIGLVCSGGRQGKQFTYTLVDDRIPKSPVFSKDEALATLAQRYFTAHGPATLQDYTWWSGLTVADAKLGLEMLKGNLVNIEQGGAVYWFARNSDIETSRSSAAYLLPNYDEYIVSYKDRSSVIHEKDISKADPRGTIFNHTLIIGEKVTGIWKREITKKALEIEIFPFRPLSKAAEASVNAAAGRYRRFLGLKELKLTIKA